LGGLFEGRKQLIVYNFMYGPDAQNPCTGCSMMVDNMGHISHLHARNTSLVLVARSPYERLAAKAVSGSSIAMASCQDHAGA
jgi:predicted dithiol-disulfide oxidoreductase (DUF899 family)